MTSKICILCGFPITILATDGIFYFHTSCRDAYDKHEAIGKELAPWIKLHNQGVEYRMDMQQAVTAWLFRQAEYDMAKRVAENA